MEKQTDITLNEPVMKTGTWEQIERRARPVTAYACTECEHCEEK